MLQLPWFWLALDAVLSRCVDAEQNKHEKIYFFNEKLLHLVDDIFWHLGFKSSEHAEKAISQTIG